MSDVKRIAFAHVLSAIVLPFLGEFIVGFVVLENRVIRSGGFVHGFIVEVRELGFVWKLLQSLDIRDDRDLFLVFHVRKMSSIRAIATALQTQGLSAKGVDFVEKALLRQAARQAFT